MDLGNLKAEVIVECKTILEERIESLSGEIQLLVEDIAEDTKSSAGDKYETSREMANMERQKLAEQLALNKKLLTMLNNLKTTTSAKVQAGSLVETSTAIIFIGVSLGVIEVSKRKILAVSPGAPLAQLLLGKKEGEVVEFNRQVYEIFAIA